MFPAKLRRCVPLLLGACVSLSACSQPPRQPEAPVGEAADPLEPVNRGIYKLNSGIDYILLRPVTRGYQYVVPVKGREMVTNFVENLYTPVVFANSVLQRDPQNSFATFWRFMLNTTLGGAGLFDFASATGLENRTADMGQTFAMYGAGPGPYVVLPLIGPSNMRDALGRLGDAFLLPTNYSNEDYITYGVLALTVLDTRSNNSKLIDDVNNTSLDPYATFRSGYTQRRATTIQRAIESRDRALEKAGHTE